MTTTPTYSIHTCKVRQRKGLPHVAIFQKREGHVADEFISAVLDGIWQGRDAARAAALVAELQAASPAGRLSILEAMKAETAKNLGR